MKRLLLPFLLGAVALLAPGRSLAQDKPVLNTAPPGTAPAPGQLMTAPTDTTSRRPYSPRPAYSPPSSMDPQPTPYSPSGLELPGREQARKAAQQHAEQYTKLFIYSGWAWATALYMDLVILI
ncbi:hypothetical protein [Hymenobacter sp. BRD67]|uniref:hypothetical protein n=1 Tax=Hymenobacter sp. BRD67 TaxID=2675877 RepID=UPI00156356CD|nr:hypothetical protein [Hymenobacter sp. BRD67]QKG52147.1 hypothetical protein GKZ67_05420 [Hymenobacter sp. BRD67]